MRDQSKSLNQLLAGAAIEDAQTTAFFGMDMLQDQKLDYIDDLHCLIEVERADRFR